jgi:hypothetical protein
MGTAPVPELTGTYLTFWEPELFARCHPGAHGARVQKISKIDHPPSFLVM